MSLRNLHEAMRAPWLSRAGLMKAADVTKLDYSKTSGFQDRHRSASGLADILTIGVDANDIPWVAGDAYIGQRMVKTFTLATNASLTSQAFWISDGNYTILGITEIHATADGAANTATIQKAVGTQSPTQGVSLMSGSFNMNGTANTLQTATLVDSNPYVSNKLNLVKGDRLCFVIASGVTSLAGVQITIAMTPGGKSLTAEYVMNVNGDIGTTTIFNANADYVVTGIQAIWSAAGTDVGAVTLDVTKDTGTAAPGAGTTCLAAVVNLKATANTVVNPALTATAATLRMAPGDRIAVKLNGTLTALAGLVVVVSFTSSLVPFQLRQEFVWTLKKNANLAVNQVFFTADRSYRVIDLSCIFSTAAGGAQKLLVTKDTGTTAPGGGTALHTDNASAGFDTNAVANTIQFGTMTTQRNSYLLAGDRLGLAWTGAAQATVGVCITATLELH